MKDKKDEMKKVAITLMRKLDIYEPYIERFERKEIPCFFENYGGFWVDQEPEVYAKMREIEKKYNCLVYAITHDYAEFGELYDFLIVTEYKEEWPELVQSNGRRHSVYAYVWNKTDDWCSEFGSILIQSFGGGIKRLA